MIFCHFIHSFHLWCLFISFFFFLFPIFNDWIGEFFSHTNRQMERVRNEKKSKSSFLKSFCSTATTICQHVIVSCVILKRRWRPKSFHTHTHTKSFNFFFVFFSIQLSSVYLSILILEFQFCFLSAAFDSIFSNSSSHTHTRIYRFNRRLENVFEIFFSFTFFVLDRRILNRVIWVNKRERMKFQHHHQRIFFSFCSTYHTHRHIDLSIIDIDHWENKVIKNNWLRWIYIYRYLILYRFRTERKKTKGEFNSIQFLDTSSD